MFPKSLSSFSISRLFGEGLAFLGGAEPPALVLPLTCFTAAGFPPFPRAFTPT